MRAIEKAMNRSHVKKTGSVTVRVTKGNKARRGVDAQIFRIKFSYLVYLLYGPQYGGLILESLPVKAAVAGTLNIPLKGFAIGNGLTDPAIQYGQYAPYAYNNSLISEELYKTIQVRVALAKQKQQSTTSHISVKKTRTLKP